jgi:hypothetical protein
MKALYALTPEEHATVLAALRFYQGALENGEPTGGVADIATNDGTVEPLVAFEVGHLCDDLNNHGLEFGDVVNLIGEDESNAFVAAAHEHRLLDEGTLEVDPKTIVSDSEEGAYVMAWLWVSNEAAGVAPGGED